MSRNEPHRRFFIPEVVQSSAMDCGPAALKSLAGGLGLTLGYGELRDACQTDVDGTSIDALEDVARALGLDAVQLMAPRDHLLMPQADLLPALAVIEQPNGLTHFVVIWRVHRWWVQVMDPATGRTFWTRDRLLRQLYAFRYEVDEATGWHWLTGDDFLGPLRARLLALGLMPADAQQRIDAATEHGRWQDVAALDAATRLTQRLVDTGGRALRARAATLVARTTERARDQGVAAIPERFWSVLPSPTGDPAAVQLCGVVLMHASGIEAPRVESVSSAVVPSVHLQAALDAREPTPLADLVGLLRRHGVIALALVAIAAVMATAGVVLEALIIDGLAAAGGPMPAAATEPAFIGGLLGLFVLLLALELPIVALSMTLGRWLEIDLRIALLQKIPRLGDRYFRTRLTSEMAQRAHELRRVRDFPSLVVRGLRLGCELVLTTVGLVWLYPEGAGLVVGSAAAILGLLLVTRPVLQEQDLRVQTHSGALARFYLDALLGVTPIRTHRAERSLHTEHESMLVKWVDASLSLCTSTVGLSGATLMLGTAIAIVIVFDYITSGGGVSGVLLLFYWVLKLPVLSRGLVGVLQQVHMDRNRVLRVTDMLSAPEEDDAGVARVPERPGERADERPDERPDEGPDEGPDERPRSVATCDPIESAGQGDREEASGEGLPSAESGSAGVAIELDDVTVQVSGHVILEEIRMSLRAGEHVAVVGSSGAGKSSLAGVLLGWHRPAAGEIRVDGKRLDASSRPALRRVTAWVDPSVQLWNRSLEDNLRYGVSTEPRISLEDAVALADLGPIVAALPSGLETTLGESGGLVSGGEGQRVRLGRALLRPRVRLVLLDEPFRGLDRARRRALLGRARQHWREATLLFISHDIDDARSFDRVLVVDGGRIVEDGSPEGLVRQPDSRFGALLAAEQAVRRTWWQRRQWRRFSLSKGRLVEQEVAEP
ncbi:MAG: ATP-binding cassette domain-containing protein [Myxococcota bacterium]